MPCPASFGDTYLRYMSPLIDAIAAVMTDKTAPQTPAEKMKAILAAKQGGAARAGQGVGVSAGKKGEALAAARSFSKSKPAMRK